MPTAIASTISPYTFSEDPEISEIPGTCPDGGIGFVPMLLLPATGTASRSTLSNQAINPVAMKFSMIVEMTSLTPRVTLSTAAIPAHIAPTSTAVSNVTHTGSGAGNANRPTTA